MRRRSGAIHSETQQQFMMLAEQSMDKTGLFYDEKMNRQIFEGHQKTKTTNYKSPFLNFDFSPEKEFERDSKKQEDHKITINIVLVLICDQAKKTCELILGCQMEGNEEGRPIDLLVRRRKGKNNNQIIFKYWVIEEGIMDSPMAQIYINSSKKQFWCSQLPNRLQSAPSIDISQFKVELESIQSQFCVQ